MLSTCFIEERKELVPMILPKSNLNMTANLNIVNNINFKNIFKHLNFPHLSIPRTRSRNKFSISRQSVAEAPT